MPCAFGEGPKGLSSEGAGGRGEAGGGVLPKAVALAECLRATRQGSVVC